MTGARENEPRWWFGQNANRFGDTYNSSGFPLRDALTPGEQADRRAAWVQHLVSLTVQCVARENAAEAGESYDVGWIQRNVPDLSYATVWALLRGRQRMTLAHIERFMVVAPDLMLIGPPARDRVGVELRGPIPGFRPKPGSTR